MFNAHSQITIPCFDRNLVFVCHSEWILWFFFGGGPYFEFRTFLFPSLTNYCPQYCGGHVSVAPYHPMLVTASAFTSWAHTDHYGQLPPVSMLLLWSYGATQETRVFLKQMQCWSPHVFPSAHYIAAASWSSYVFSLLSS